MMNASAGPRRDVSAGPRWDDPQLDALSDGLRVAHVRVAALPATIRPQLTRHLLLITDLAKRDAPLALRRLESFLKDLNSDENVP